MTNFAKLESDQVNNLSINTKIIFSPDNRNAKKKLCRWVFDKEDPNILRLICSFPKKSCKIEIKAFKVENSNQLSLFKPWKVT